MSRQSTIKSSIFHVVLQLAVFILFVSTMTEVQHVSKNSIVNLFSTANTTVLLTCPTEANETEWRLLDYANGTGGRILQTHTNIFQLSQVTHQDEGMYACLKNSSHIIMKYNLTLHQPPYFTKKMNTYLIKPDGNTVRLRCKAQGIPAPDNIVWYKNGESPIRRKMGDVKITHWSLILEDLISDDTGNYTCSVCNSVGCTNHTFLLEIVVRYSTRPIQLHHFKNTTLTVGANFTLSCNFIRNSPLKIKWTKLDNVSTESVEKILKVSAVEETNSEIYEIVNATLEDEGWYTCTAENVVGLTQFRAYIQVVEKKSSTPQYDNLNI